MQVQSFHPKDLYYIKYHVCLPQFFFLQPCSWDFQGRLREYNRYNWAELSRGLNWINLLLCRKQNALPGGSKVCSLWKIWFSWSCYIQHLGHFWVTFFNPDIEIMLESVRYFLSVITIRKLNNPIAGGFLLLTIF